MESNTFRVENSKGMLLIGDGKYDYVLNLNSISDGR